MSVKCIKSGTIIYYISYIGWSRQIVYSFREDEFRKIKKMHYIWQEKVFFVTIEANLLFYLSWE